MSYPNRISISRYCFVCGPDDAMGDSCQCKVETSQKYDACQLAARAASRTISPPYQSAIPEPRRSLRHRRRNERKSIGINSYGRPLIRRVTTELRYLVLAHQPLHAGQQVTLDLLLCPLQVQCPVRSRVARAALERELPLVANLTDGGKGDVTARALSENDIPITWWRADPYETHGASLRPWCLTARFAGTDEGWPRLAPFETSADHWARQQNWSLTHGFCHSRETHR